MCYYLQWMEVPSLHLVMSPVAVYSPCWPDLIESLMVLCDLMLGEASMCGQSRVKNLGV